MMFYAAFNSISVISRRQLTLFMSSWVSPVLGWGSKVSCPKTLLRKDPEDPVRLESRTPGLRVKHFTTEPRRTPKSISSLYSTRNMVISFGTLKKYIYLQRIYFKTQQHTYCLTARAVCHIIE